MSDKILNKLPELLCPAGSRRAFEAAIEGGADAVYLGGTLFNARINAENFTNEILKATVGDAHTYGAKIYLTLNTAVYDKELKEVLSAADAAADAGVDALIVADLGAANEIHKRIPKLPLHASTQMTGHNAEFGKCLSKLGYTRAVLARELSLRDIEYVTANNPLEIEVFVHGALCVSQSGQCLFSSVVGGRSGNRGECAQPCRLPYFSQACSVKPIYPLSLKDLSLAPYVPELIRANVSSLKIEGRMKSPEYVFGVTKIWRRLLDERRAASSDEMRELAEMFSRGGFTDGYFKEKITHSMMGVRSDADKNITKTLKPFAGGITRKQPIDVSVTFKKNTPIEITLSGANGQVSAIGACPEIANNRPMTRDDIVKNATKFGGTAYSAEKITVDMQDGLILPVSALNAIRRDAVEKYTKLVPENKYSRLESHTDKPTGSRKPHKTARFYSINQITESATEYFDILYLPLFSLDGLDELPENIVKAQKLNKLGVIMPPAMFDSEREIVERRLEHAKQLGVTHLLVGNLGAIETASKYGFELHGDYRFNVTNSSTVAMLEKLGINNVIASPELSAPQLRDLKGNTSAIVYGRLPLMTLEKCAIKEIADCNTCQTGKAILRDRRGVEFPILRERNHRNIIYNSLPTCMSDKQNQLIPMGINAWHFVFSTESADEVDGIIKAFVAGAPLNTPVRRLPQ